MKTAATLITALALASGAAFAGTYGNDPAKAPRHDTTAAAAEQSSGEGIVDKTKRALHRMGDKMRSAGHRVANATHSNERKDANDTRAMGAAGSDQDQARRQRMDDAYGNWHSKQEKR